MNKCSFEFSIVGAQSDIILMGGTVYGHSPLQVRLYNLITLRPLFSFSLQSTDYNGVRSQNDLWPMVSDIEFISTNDDNHGNGSLKPQLSFNNNVFMINQKRNKLKIIYLHHNKLCFNVSETTRMTQGHANMLVFIHTDTKKPSCRLKYIIFQRLSIITHFLAK